MEGRMIEPLCEGRDCVVVGSAPGPSFSFHDPRTIVIGANGGASLARKYGMVPHVLVTTAHLFRESRSKQEQATYESLRGLCLHSVWVDEKNGPASTVSGKRFDLRLSYGRLRGVSPQDRADVVRRAVGESAWVSTGVWAICLAVVSGAKTVATYGISLGVGHAGMPWDRAPRDHVFEDEVTLRRLRRNGVRLPLPLERQLA
jgi:hypothetical protein